jgi:protein phosphatase PTC1
MKEFVIGSPYTTETELDDEDEFLIVACDGVSLSPCCDVHFY